MFNKFNKDKIETFILELGEKFMMFFVIAISILMVICIIKYEEPKKTIIKEEVIIVNMSCDYNYFDEFRIMVKTNNGVVNVVYVNEQEYYNFEINETVLVFYEEDSHYKDDYYKDDVDKKLYKDYLKNAKIQKLD